MFDPNRLPTPKLSALSQRHLRILRAQARNLLRPPVWGSALLVMATISFGGSYLANFNQDSSSTATDTKTSPDSGNPEQEELAKTLAEKETRAQAANIDSSSVLLQKLEDAKQQNYEVLNPEQTLSSQHGTVGLEREVMEDLVPDEVRQQIDNSSSPNSQQTNASDEAFNVNDTFISNSQTSEETSGNNPWVASGNTPSNRENPANTGSFRNNASATNLNAHPYYNPIGGIDLFSAIQANRNNSSTSSTDTNQQTETGEGATTDFWSQLRSNSANGERMDRSQQTPVERDVRNGSQVYPPRMGTTPSNNTYAYPLPNNSEANTNTDGNNQGNNNSFAGGNSYASPLPNANSNNAGNNTNNMGRTGVNPNGNLSPSTNQTNPNTTPPLNRPISPTSRNSNANFGTNATQGSFSVRENPYQYRGNRNNQQYPNNATGNNNNRSRNNLNQPALNRPATNQNNQQQAQPFSVPRPVPGQRIGGGRINTFANP